MASKGLRSGIRVSAAGKGVSGWGECFTKKRSTCLAQSQYYFLDTGANTGLRAGVQEEGSPVKRLAIVSGGVDQCELGVAESGCRVLALCEVFVELVHQLRGGRIANFPQAADDMVSPGAEERPREADEPLAGIGFETVAIASGDGDEIGGERTLQDVASIELERVALRGKDNCGFEGLKAASRAMGSEMEKRKALWVAVEVGRRFRVAVG